ncbi:LWR-salt protein [Halarchaeum sp. P4]|uniref:LWR-salt protein n=1 Tax=Halarchaeum sp. P4 TaxID=3421639 RepID=UPI003EBE001E
MEGRYVFAVRFRLEPAARDVSLEPNSFETRLYRDADEPGEEGWRFFRDNLWRGELADDAHFRDLTAEALDVTVLSVEYRSFEVDEEYRTAFREAIADDLEAFRADTVDEVVNKYLGSSLEVQTAPSE